MHQNSSLSVIVLAGLLAAGFAQAKVTQEQANKLGTVLTPMGAIKEGNGAGLFLLMPAPCWEHPNG